MSIDSVLQTERETRKFRLLALPFVSLGIFYRQETVSLLPATILAAGYLVYLLWVPRMLRAGGHANLVYALVAVDGLAIAAGFVFAGSIENPLIGLVALSILYYSLFFGYVSGIIAASYFTVLYVAVAVYLGAAEQAGEVLAIQAPLFFSLALLGGYLTRKRFREEQERAELQEMLRMEVRARGLLEAVQDIAGGKVLEDTVEIIARDAPTILNFDGAIVAAIDLDLGRLIPRAVSESPPGWDAENVDAIGPFLAISIESQLLEDRSVWSTSATAEMPSWAQALDASSIMAEPLVDGDQVVGALVLWSRRQCSATDFEMSTLSTYANLAAAIVARTVVDSTARRRASRHMAGLQTAIARVEGTRERGREIVVGNLVLRGADQSAFVDEEAVQLSPTEFDVLYVLAQSVGQPLNQETILRRVWGEGTVSQGNAVDVAIHRIRRKIPTGVRVPKVVTVRGRGYKLENADEASMANVPGASPSLKRPVAFPGGHGAEAEAISSAD